MADRLTRIAIVSNVRCKPKKFRQECKKSCPVVTTERLCIEVTSVSKIAFISEELCTGCGICVKVLLLEILLLCCELVGGLFMLPVPRPGQVLGLVGTNGIGKSTALKVLAGKLKPNLGRFTNPPDWQEILTYFRGSELQNYFTRILEDDLKVMSAPLFNMYACRDVLHLDITFRRDPTNFRPRINKLDSTKDREQKSAGSYYYLDD
ncbi:ABC transporter E family member 2 [Glycine soja]|nr:ABC transporter E family member 2 [Glycine soja]